MKTSLGPNRVSGMSNTRAAPELISKATLINLRIGRNEYSLLIIMIGLFQTTTTGIPERLGSSFGTSLEVERDRTLKDEGRGRIRGEGCRGLPTCAPSRFWMS